MARTELFRKNRDAVLSANLRLDKLSKTTQNRGCSVLRSSKYEKSAPSIEGADFATRRLYADPSRKTNNRRHQPSNTLCANPCQACKSTCKPVFLQSQQQGSGCGPSSPSPDCRITSMDAARTDVSSSGYLRVACPRKQVAVASSMSATSVEVTDSDTGSLARYPSYATSRASAICGDHVIVATATTTITTMDIRALYLVMIDLLNLRRWHPASRCHFRVP